MQTTDTYTSINSNLKCGLKLTPWFKYHVCTSTLYSSKFYWNKLSNTLYFTVLYTHTFECSFT